MAELQGRRRFAHLFRRAGFGPSEAELNAAIALSPDPEAAFTMAVDGLLNYENVPEVADRFSPTDPSATPDGVVESSTTLWWLDRMVRTRRPLLEKMTLFWHDHFATSGEKEGIIPRMASQNQLLRANALGNFENMLRAISRDPSMMLWQDIVSNKKGNPNENFARELMELFSLGIGQPGSPNYSEADIKEATRAFTGYTIGTDGNWTLNSAQHDSGTKTVLGQTCESGDDVMHILVNYKKNGKNVCARFIAAKLFSWFVWPVTPEDPLIDGFAQTFVNSNFSIKTLMDAILKSPQFSSNAAYRSQEKNPVEVSVGALRTLGAERFPYRGAFIRTAELGMRLFFPPDVGGWTSGRGWINASTLIGRWNMQGEITVRMGMPEALDPGGPPSVNTIAGMSDPAQRVDRLLYLFVDSNVTDAERSALISFSQAANSDDKLRGLISLVMALPAYQLN